MSSTITAIDNSIDELRGKGLFIVAGTVSITGTTATTVAIGRTILQVLSVVPKSGTATSTAIAHVTVNFSVGGSNLYITPAGPSGAIVYSFAVVAY